MTTENIIQPLETSLPSYIPEADGFSSRYLRITGKNFNALVRYEFLAELNERRLLDLISEEVGFRSDHASPGRAAVRRVTFDSGRRVIFRRFFRGGLVRKFNRELFLRWSSKLELSRPEWELRILDLLHERGRRVPKPVASMTSLSFQGFAYRGAIASEEIQHADNLLSIVRERSRTEDQVVAFCRAAGVEAGLILREGILHRDLHLGNVITVPNRNILLLDFDSARLVRHDTDFLRGRVFLERRWARSLRRHSLPERYCSVFVEGLEEGIQGGLKQKHADMQEVQPLASSEGLDSNPEKAGIGESNADE